MKTKVLIIEDNFSKFFSTKAILEAQLKLDVDAKDIGTGTELAAATLQLSPDMVMIRPEGGVVEVLKKLKKRGSNRRNTEITLLLTQDFDDEVIRQFEQALAQQTRSVANAA